MRFAVFYEKFNRAGDDWINATLPINGCFFFAVVSPAKPG